MTSSTADVHPDVPPIHPEDPDDEWIVTTNSGRSLRVQVVTGALLMLCVLGAGFWGGVVAEKHHGSGTTPASALASRFAAARAGAATGAGSAFAFGGGAAPAASGTVIDASGNTIDVTDTNGNLVKVIVGPSATITRTSASSVAGLQVGDTVIVTGSTAANGTVTATAVRATAQGVTAGTGRGGGAAAG